MVLDVSRVCLGQSIESLCHFNELLYMLILTNEPFRANTESQVVEHQEFCRCHMQSHINRSSPSSDYSKRVSTISPTLKRGAEIHGIELENLASTCWTTVEAFGDIDVSDLNNIPENPLTHFSRAEKQVRSDLKC